MVGLTGKRPSALFENSEGEETSEEWITSTEDEQSESEEEIRGIKKRAPSKIYTQNFNVSEVNLDFVELKKEITTPSLSSNDKHVLESTDQENKPVSRMDPEKARQNHYFEKRDNYNENYLKNFNQTYKHDQPVVDQTINKEEAHTFRVALMFPSILFSNYVYQVSALMSEETFNQFSALFIDSFFGFNIAQTIYMVRYTDKELTRKWNAFWLFLVYPAFWWFVIKDKIKAKKEKRAKDIFKRAKK